VGIGVGSALLRETGPRVVLVEGVRTPFLMSGTEYVTSPLTTHEHMNT
jgi:hypothetical protein